MFLAKLLRKPVQLNRAPAMYFRSFKNPLVESDVKLNPVEIDSDRDLPVWQRLFDHKKYMSHEGPLKMTTGLAMVDVEPFPRLKLMKLYYMTLEELRDVPDSYKYKFYVEELCKYRMEVVDNNTSIRKIEETIYSGMIEELIIQAHNELKLLKIEKKTKPWDHQEVMEDISAKEELTNITPQNVFPSPVETYKYDRHDRPSRDKTAGFSRGGSIQEE